MLEGLEHVHRFPLSSRNVNISIGTPYNLIYGYQTNIITTLILLYELKNTKPMPSFISLKWYQLIRVGKNKKYPLSMKI